MRMRKDATLQCVCGRVGRILRFHGYDASPPLDLARRTRCHCIAMCILCEARGASGMGRRNGVCALAGGSPLNGALHREAPHLLFELALSLWRVSHHLYSFTEVLTWAIHAIHVCMYVCTQQWNQRSVWIHLKHVGFKFSTVFLYLNRFWMHKKPIETVLVTDKLLHLPKGRKFQWCDLWNVFLEIIRKADIYLYICVCSSFSIWIGTYRSRSLLYSDRRMRWPAVCQTVGAPNRWQILGMKFLFIHNMYIWA